MLCKVHLPGMKSITASAFTRDPLPRTIKRWDDLKSEPTHLIRGVPFYGPLDGRDRDGEYFHPSTNLYAKLGDEVLLTYCHGVNPDLTVQDPPIVIGAAKLESVDDTGYWLAAKYDTTTALGLYVASTPPKQLKASSGATSHLTRIHDGKIDDWWLSELAVFSVSGKMKPANDWAIVLPYSQAKSFVVPEIPAGKPKSSEAAKAEEDNAAETSAQPQPLGTTADNEQPPNSGTSALPNEQALDKQTEEYPMENNEQTAKSVANEQTAQAKQAKPQTEQPQAAKSEQLQSAAQTTPQATPAQATPVKANTPTDNLKAVAPNAGQPVNAGLVATKPAKSNENAVKAFDIWLRTGQTSKSFDQTAAAGVLPPTYGKKLIEAIANVSVFDRYNLGRRQKQTTDIAYWPMLTHSDEAPIVGPGQSYGEAEPSTGLIETKLYKFGPIAKVPEEVIADASVNIWNDIIVPDIALRFAKARDHWFTVGSGTGQPEGVFNASVAITTQSAVAIDPDEIIDLFYKLPVQYRSAPNVFWVMNDATLGYLRKLKTNDGQYLVQPGLREEGMDRILGKPVVTSAYAPTITASAKVIVLGNFDYFWIFQHPQTMAQRLVEKYADTGEIGYRAFRRWTSKIMLSEAFVSMKMADA